MRGEAFARQLKLLALLERRPEGIELEEAAGTLGPPSVSYLTGLGAAGEIEPKELREAVLREHRDAVAGLDGSAHGRASPRVTGGG